MSGFVSTSLEEAEAVEFAVKNLKPGKTPILQEIIWKCYMYHLRLNNSEWTAYKKEKEVLLFDGQAFRVIDIIPNCQVRDKKNKVHTVTKMVLRFDID